MAKKLVVADVTMSVAELLAGNKARPSGRGHRSQLYLWLRGHHDLLAEGFGRNGPSWSHIARQLGDNGVYDGTGKQPAPETVRATWYRVRRDVAAARARRAGPASERAVPCIALVSTAPSASPSAPVSPSAGDLDPRPRKFGLAQLRGHPSSTPAPPPPAPEPERIRRSPEEVERIIADMMSGAPKNPFRRDKGD
jgi:hypothetical protein